MAPLDTPIILLDRASAAERLKSCKEQILVSWQRCVREVVPAAAAQSPSDLIDSLPDFLDGMILVVSPTHPNVEGSLCGVSRKHGQLRAKLRNYTLKQVLLEHRILREVVFSLNAPII